MVSLEGFVESCLLGCFGSVRFTKSNVVNGFTSSVLLGLVCCFSVVWSGFLVQVCWVRFAGSGVLGQASWVRCVRSGLLNG